jgi:hypothetical protein
VPDVIHVATAHHHSADWIEIQRAYLDRYVGEPFRTYGSLEGVDPAFDRYFDVVVPSKGPHAGKLNLLAQVIIDQAEPDDLILFLDGDAFPVADVASAVRPHLESNALVAVQRLENHGDDQPHPCFCVVPVHVWSSLPGDWSAGHPIREGRSDVGGNLAWLLARRGLRWHPLLRTHSVTDHPLLFAVYDRLVYHHGAGFRGVKPPGQGREGWSAKLPESREGNDRMAKLKARDPEAYDRFIKAALEVSVLSEQVYEMVRDDPNLFERLLADGPLE